MKRSRINPLQSQKIEALVESGQFTYQDIANSFDNEFTINQIQYHINKNYKDIKKNIPKEYSRGGSKLLHLLSDIFPRDKITSEFHLGGGLRADFLVGSPYNIAFEYDGSQHDTYTSHFHGDKTGFNNSKQRDSLKAELLSKRGISLVRIYQLTIDGLELKNLIENVGYGSGVLSDPSVLTTKERQDAYKKQATLRTKQLQKDYQAKIKSQLQKESKEHKQNVESRDTSYEDSMKEKQRQHRKEQYQRQKEWKKNNMT